MFDPRREKLSLTQASQPLIEECRMVLPGIQALFGFQCSVVFSEGFSQKLCVGEQYPHLLTFALLAFALVPRPHLKTPLSAKLRFA